MIVCIIPTSKAHLARFYSILIARLYMCPSWSISGLPATRPVCRLTHVHDSFQKFSTTASSYHDFVGSLIAAPAIALFIPEASRADNVKGNSDGFLDATVEEYLPEFLELFQWASDRG